MKQVYRIDGEGFYLEPLILHPEIEERRELLPPLEVTDPVATPVDGHGDPIEVPEEPVEESPEEPIEEIPEEPVEGEPEETVEETTEGLLDRPSLSVIEEGEDRYYVYFEEVYNIPEDCVEVAPPSYFKPKWVTNKWVEAGVKPVTPEALPTVDEKVESLEQQVADLMFMMMTGGM